MRRVAIYARVRTSEQSSEMQLRDLRELAEHRAFEVVREYNDTGISGAADSRPALDDLLADARRGRFKAVLVWKLDRLGRSLPHLVRLLEELQQMGVELISLSEGLDFTTTVGKLLYQMISAFSEFERDCIRERVRAGMRNARARGKRIGRPPVVVDVAEVARLRAQEASWREIAEKLGVGATTARRAFSRLAKSPVEIPSSSKIPQGLGPETN
ncbi:MAG: recombinase family protein [Acidobacteria bacterium]|nr:recombinase family protein [Acidobacteriota bacterium]